MWVIYLISSIGGFYLSALINPMVPSVGASAGLCGMIGAMIALGIWDRSGMGSAIRGIYIRWAIYILIFSFLPGVDMMAHIGGFAAGFGVAYLAGTPRYEGSPAEAFWKGGAWVCLAITALSFLKMYLWFTRVAQ
jgi:rhomboid protease GluP